MKMLRELIGWFLPRAEEGEQGQASNEPDGVAPTGAQEAVSDPGTPQDGDTEREALEQNAANLAWETKEAEYKAKIEELEGSVDKRAEERLYELMPDLPDALSQERQAPLPQPEQPVVELTDDERLVRLEALDEQRRHEIEGDRLLAEMGGHREKYPRMDDAQVLSVMARAGNSRVNVERLCEMSHKSQLGRLETYHQEKMQDRSYMEGVVKEYLSANQSGDDPPPIPALGKSGGAPVAQQKITRRNAASIFAERLEKSGFGRKSVGPTN